MSDAAYMLIRTAGQTLAIPSEFTRQVVPLEQIAPLPAARGVLLGLMAAAGRVVPVLNVDRVLGQQQAPGQSSSQSAPNPQAVPEPASLSGVAGAASPVADDAEQVQPEQPQPEQGQPGLSQAGLALLLEMDAETLCLPLNEVIGFISDEKETFAAGSFLSDEKVLGGYSGGGHKGRFLNPPALFQEVTGRLMPV